MEDLAVGLTKSVVQGALSKVQSAIEEDANLRQRAQRNLVLITLEFKMMQSFLDDANKDAIKNKLVATWVSHIHELAYDVEDCIELVVHLDDRPNWWRRLLPSCMAGPLPLDDAVEEIEQLKARAEDVSKCYKRYRGINDNDDSCSKLAMLQQQASIAAAGATAAAPNMPTDASAAVMQSLGGDLTQLITKRDNDLQVISVRETGGTLGTTPIIWKAYGDPLICIAFPCRAWVKLMHPFNPHEFILSLLAQFYATSSDEQKGTIGVQVLTKMEATQDLLAEFERLVTEKRFLVVLEDLSTLVEWDAIMKFLPDRKKGSRIVVSTHQFHVATLCVGRSYQELELKQFSPTHSVCAYLKEGAQVSLSFSQRARGDLSSHDKKILACKMKAAANWMEKNPLVGSESKINELRQCVNKAHFSSSPVISVWGMAGVGKSALVRKLYSDRMLESSLFHKYGWVDVSHPFNLRDFCRNLFLDFYSESLQPNEAAYRGMMGSKNPIQDCRELLKQHPCLIIIDDVQSSEEWDLIQAALVSKPSKSVIVVITTDASIASYCTDKEDFVFNVKNLEADAAFELFRKEVHKKNPVDYKDLDVEELVLKCGGLPKVIVAIAGLVATRPDTFMDDASSVNRRFMHNLETNPEFDRSLRGLYGGMHSYFRALPDVLKPCIFYLSIFRGGSNIRRRRLVRRWIAEGYSRDSDDKSAEENGEKFFSKLLDLSIIQRPRQKSVTTALEEARTVLCQINGFVHEYIISRIMEDNLVFGLGGSCSLSTQRRGRHLIILENWDRERIVFENIDFSRLRSLTVLGMWESFFISEHMKLLRVLDLENVSGVTDQDLEQMVKLLRRLKFLSLRGCIGIFHLPSSIGDLRQLQTLDVRNTSIVTLPASITNLQKLQYIRAGTTIPAEEPSTPCVPLSWLTKLCRRHHQVGVEVPGVIGNLTALHTLGVVNVAASEGKVIMKELQKLTQLRKLGVSGINRKNNEKFISAISVHVHLESLSVWLDKDNHGCMDGISLPFKLESLQCLKLYGLGDKLPVSSNQLSTLRKLDLEMANLMEDDIKFLGKLPRLCILRLHVKQIRDGKLNFSVYYNRGAEEYSFEKVKILEIACSSNLHVAFGSQAMRSLEVLKTDCCSGSSLKFSGLENLKELKEALL